MRVLVTLVVGFFLLLAALPAAAQDHSAEESQAVEAALAWLALVDARDYAASYDNASEFFRGVVVKSEWERMLAGVRSPLGDTVSRAVDQLEYVTSLPGAPDGEYVVIQFNTTYANKDGAIETVTPMRDPDGVWRVSGYSIY